MAAVVFIFGLVIGSFLNVCIYRIPLDKSIVYPPSSCPYCGNRIKWYDNVPVLSYLFLGGRCRFCKEKISLIYPFIEILTATISLLIYIKYGLSIQMAVFLILSYMLIVGSFIDLKYYIIPDRISFGLILFGIISSYFVDIGVLHSILGAVFGFLILYIVAVLGKIIFKKDAMGGGDIKLLAGIGAFLGIKGVLFTLFFASFLGSIVGVTLILLGKKDISSRLPFGPFLSVSAIVYLFAGVKIIYMLYGF